MPVFKSCSVGGTQKVLYGEAVLRGPTPYLLSTEYRIMSECKNKKIAKKKYYPCIHFLVPLFKRLGIILLDYYTVLLCNKKIGTFADMDTDPIVSPLAPPLPEVQIPRRNATRTHFVVINNL